MLTKFTSTILFALVFAAECKAGEATVSDVVRDINSIFEAMGPKKVGTPEMDGSLINQGCDLPFLFYLKHHFKTHSEITNLDEMLNSELETLNSFVRDYTDPINVEMVVQDFTKELLQKLIEAPHTQPIDILFESLRKIWPEASSEAFTFGKQSTNYVSGEYLVIELSTELTISAVEMWTHSWTVDFRIKENQSYELDKVQIKSITKRQDLHADVARWIDYDSKLIEAKGEPLLAVPDVGLRLTLEERKKQLTHVLKNCTN
ncbi:MAG: hypothetical protein SGJ18_10365 [Pseudomonadota bacterium]|nr:hypothetical protein [Pseudomonadota bacterium]